MYEEPEPVLDEERAFMIYKPYREVLGALMYPETRTRPEIATAVSLSGRKFQADPGPKQWRNLQQVVRYLIQTTDYGIYLPKSEGKVEVQAYSDADWARYLHNLRSPSGYILYINSAPVIWSSKLQTYTAESTAKAEFTALHPCVREVC